MIVRPQVFDDSHLPRTLLHREGEGEVLATAVRAVGAGNPADSVLVSGKTALARHTLDRMEAKPGVPSTHVRALGATRGRCSATRSPANPEGERPASNVPVGDLEGQLRALVYEPHVVILDKADDLAGTDIPGTLLEI